MTKILMVLSALLSSPLAQALCTCEPIMYGKDMAGYALVQYTGKHGVVRRSYLDHNACLMMTKTVYYCTGQPAESAPQGPN